MGTLFLAIFAIVLGAVIRSVGPSIGKPGAAGSARLAGYAFMAVGILLAISNGVAVVSVGEVGVKHFLGSVDTDPLAQGVHLINPMANVEKMSTREQAFPADGTVEQIDAQTSEQLNVALEVSILYRIDPANAPDLYQRLGSEDQIKQSIVLNSVRNGVRDAVATKSINDIFSPNRREVAADMKAAIQAKAGDRIEVLDVFVRDVQAPPKVREAIEEKLQREQQVAAERFQTEIIQEKAKQKIEEARGIAEAQKIINVDLTDRYLMLRYIEALQNLPAGALVIAPTQGGVPLLLNPGGR
jgi:regulator of protease activity HflC (stomatin/prohibitin superfamily)